MNESVSVTLELRNGSREVVREIERIGCNPSSFIQEWKEQPMIMRVRKIVSSLVYSLYLLHHSLRVFSHMRSREYTSNQKSL